MFGSILAATDPVAVVAILKDLGAPEKLTMCVTGESLMNDGTAIVLFNLFKAQALGTTEALEAIGADPEVGLTSWWVVKYFCWMSVGGIVIGWLFGIIALMCLSRASRKTGHEDIIIQVAVTLILPYAAFFVGEHFAGVSGVLATVSAALVVAAGGWAHFVSREAMDSVWHVVEFIGNTIIFFLAGVILGDRIGGHVSPFFISSSASYNLIDIGLLLIVYTSSMAIRFFMVLILRPLLSRIGYGFTMKSAIVLSWGGLRGAVGLALALDVDISFTKQNKDTVLGDQMLFHVGGMAMLTLLINGVTSGLLVDYLELSTADKYHEILLHDVDRRVHETCVVAFEKEVQALDLGEEQRARVQERVRALHVTTIRKDTLTEDICERSMGLWQSKQTIGDEMSPPGNEKSFARRSFAHFSHVAGANITRQTRAVRQLFLSMLRNQYVDLVDRGLLLKHGRVTVILHASVDVAMESVETGLSDWDDVIHALNNGLRFTLLSLLDWFIQHLPESRTCLGRFIEDRVENATFAKRQRTICYILLCFILAHKQTQAALQEVLEGDEGGDLGGARVALSRINFESDEEIDKAEIMLAGMDQSIVQDAKVEQCVSVVLESERRFIMQLVDQGVLQDKEGHHLLEAVREDKSASSRAAQKQRIQVREPSDRSQEQGMVELQESSVNGEFMDCSLPLDRIISGHSASSLPGTQLPRSSGSDATSSDIMMEPSDAPFLPRTLAQSRKSTSSNFSSEALMGVSSSGPWTKLSTRGAAIRSSKSPTGIRSSNGSIGIGIGKLPSTNSSLSMTAWPSSTTAPSWGFPVQQSSSTGSNPSFLVPPSQGNANGNRSLSPRNWQSPRSMLGESVGD